MASFVTAVIIFVFVAASSENLNECNNPDSKCCYNGAKDNLHNLIFNLCPLKLTQDSQIPYYQVIDSVYNGDHKGYRYTFNIGDSPLQYPSNVCAMHQGAYCNTFTSQGACQQPLNLINDTFPAIAWAYMEKIDEITGRTRECWNLAGADVEIRTYPASNFLSPMKGAKNWASGIQLQYKNGDYDEYANRNRYLNTYIMCKNTYNGDGIVKARTILRSKPRGEYSPVFENIYGCPITCISGSQLCSTNGVCGYDYTLNNARCYCFQGFTGKFCEIYQENEDDDQIMPEKDDINEDDENEQNQWIYTIPTDYLSTSGNPLNLHFDLNAMVEEIGEYMKIENLNDENTEFYLNFGGKMHDRERMNISRNAYTKCYELDNGNGYGFLYKILEEECYLLGRDFQYGLIDETHPAKGWYWRWINNDINSTNDDECAEEGRSFTIYVYCPDSDETITNQPPDVPYPIQRDDYTGCKWETQQILGVGCPSACITESKSEVSVNSEISQELIEYSVCGLHGVCALDPYKEAATCLCDTGYEGDDCSIPIIYHPTSMPTLSPTDNNDNNGKDHPFMTLNKQMFLIVVGGVSALILLLIVALIICKCYYDGQRKLKQERYQHLQNNDYELSEIEVEDSNHSED